MKVNSIQNHQILFGNKGVQKTVKSSLVKYPTIEDFFIEGKVTTVPSKIIEQIDEHMERYHEKRLLEEFLATEESKKIVLNV